MQKREWEQVITAVNTLSGKLAEENKPTQRCQDCFSKEKKVPPVTKVLKQVVERTVEKQDEQLCKKKTRM